ncbi:hypothetical protein PN499_13945 [Kamptonema animale CS-326]|jgi:hypothetical protein|uniref:P-loop NTPase fold protein n=1 Tax=Kamptonema animale TaxID=92934 RepID=UPI00232E283E|nr:P-loop NTPase fold protein [Kamptonema animale]MDB9512290.1 hypothetical protein [Kamptonema animale CS-326]
MSNRLKFFREQMAAFEGAVDPQRAIESGYYIREPRKSVSELISGRIGLRPSSTHLLLGGIGSGKTTQLLVTRNRINEEVEDISAHYVDVSLYTDISKISTGTLTAVVGVVFSELMQDSDEEAIRKDIKLIKDIAYGYSGSIGDIEFDSYNENLLSDFVHSMGILVKKSHEQEKKVLQAISRLDKAAAEKYGDIILLFDGLDRLDNTQSFLQLVTTDLQNLSSIGIGLVIVGHLRAFYDNQELLKQAVNYFDYRSCFDVEDDADAYSFFEKIIEVRASEGFIEQSALQSLIHYSGGVLRDLINLTQASIEEAYLADSENLQQTHVETSVASFGRAKLLGLSDRELEILLDMLVGNTFLPITDEGIILLVTGRILEYRYPKARYTVHPAIRPLLQFIQKDQKIQHSLNNENL